MNIQDIKDHSTAKKYIDLLLTSFENNTIDKDELAYYLNEYTTRIIQLTKLDLIY